MQQNQFDPRNLFSEPPAQKREKAALKKKTSLCLKPRQYFGGMGEKQTLNLYLYKTKSPILLPREVSDKQL